MAQETETKILNIDLSKLLKKLQKLKAKKTQDTRLVVDWFRLVGTKVGEDPWYLRIRTYADGKSEVTWKGKSEVLGASRTHKEINFLIQDPEMLGELFEMIGLENYAHQEKNRISFKLKDWKLDIDTYPNMPPYLEIEGKDEEHIQQALEILELGGFEASSEGERILIQEKYNLDWYNMRF